MFEIKNQLFNTHDNYAIDLILWFRDKKMVSAVGPHKTVKASLPVIQHFVICTVGVAMVFISSALR